MVLHVSYDCVNGSFVKRTKISVGAFYKRTIHTIIRCMEKSFNANDVTLAVFLGFKGAFDKVPTISVIILLKLRGAVWVIVN